jgi:PTH1 family peptidyl-tRNA hydrolase
MGFMVVDRVAERCRCASAEQKYRADVARTTRGGRPMVFVKPRTFMNESGYSVGPAAAALCAPDLSDLLVVLDDVHLEFGRLRLRRGGGDGGHNGLASVIEQLGTDNVPRLRVGIGGTNTFDRVEYVLDEFCDEELDELPDVIELASDAVMVWFYRGIDKAMNKVNMAPAEDEERENEE